MSLAFFSGGSNSYFLLCAVALFFVTLTFCSGERDLQCLCCAAVLFFTNRSLSSGERDSRFLCASALVSKNLSFSQEEGTHVVSCVHQHYCIKFELFHWERRALDIVSLLQNLFSNFVRRNIQHAF